MNCFSLATATDHTMSSLTSSYCSTTSSLDTTTDDMDDFDLVGETSSFCSSNFSVCSSDVDHIQSSSASSIVTAESVARSLIRHISHENKLPVEINVQWLISEHDAPQQVKSTTINNTNYFHCLNHVHKKAIFDNTSLKKK